VSRRFVALGLPATLVEMLAARWEGIGWDRSRLRATRPSGWHLTLAYLGETSTSVVPRVVAVLESLRASAPPVPELRLAAGCRLGRSVLAIEVADLPGGAVAALGARIQTDLAAAGVPVAQGVVRPHVTLARARRPVRPSDIALASSALAGLDAELRAWVPDTVGLWVARPGTGPARYGVEVAVPLGR